MTDLDYSTDLAAYERELSPLAVSDAAADLLFRDGRTAYAFTDQPVTDAEVQALHDLAKWGPTAMNAQPLRVVLVRSDEARARLVPLMSGNNRDRVAAAPLVALLASDVDFHHELPRVFPVHPGARDHFEADEPGRAATAHTNAVLQAGYLLLAARAVGLAAGPMAGFDADAVAAEFFPDGRHRVFMVVNLGHAGEESYRPRQTRLGFDEVVSVV